MPGDYVTELADQAFREIRAGLGTGIERIVGTLPDAQALAETLLPTPISRRR
jgi:hypothetical protein